MKSYPLFLFLITFFSCTTTDTQQSFSAFLSEPCMIVNAEQNNTDEGTYITVDVFNGSDSSLKFQCPDNFFITEANMDNWVVGWGSNQRYYDSGVENLREIRHIDTKQNKLSLGSLVRGTGFPQQSQRLVFWNKNPSGFKNILKQPIIDVTMWPEFAGPSISYSTIEYDSLLQAWVMLANECDTSKIQIYAAVSTDLVHWKASNNGNPILRASDFTHCSWSGMDNSGLIFQTPFVSEIIRRNNRWYVFLDGYAPDGTRHIGLAISDSSLLGPFEIADKPIISPGVSGSWNDQGCFYAKIEESDHGYVMLFDGKNSDGLERIGMAFSDDLVSWTQSTANPVIDAHTGWRSAGGTTEPAYFEIRHDTILVLCAGVKAFNTGFWSRFVTRRMFMDVSGNVDDTQLGLFLSTDFGRSFKAHPNNPMFTNDYSNVFENEHMGGNFRMFKTDTAEIIIYQGKSSFQGPKYNILLRQR